MKIRFYNTMYVSTLKVIKISQTLFRRKHLITTVFSQIKIRKY